MVHRSVQELVRKGTVSKGMFKFHYHACLVFIACSFLGENWIVKKKRLQMTLMVAWVSTKRESAEIGMGDKSSLREN